MYISLIKLTSMRRMSMDRTVVKKNICRKKSDTRPTTAKRQNSWKHNHISFFKSSQRSRQLQALDSGTNIVPRTVAIFGIVKLALEQSSKMVSHLTRVVGCFHKEKKRGRYLDGRHQGEVSDEDDAQLGCHVLHDGPALITQTWTGDQDVGLLVGKKEEGDQFMWQWDVLD